MDNAINLLLREGTVALAVAVVIATFFTRRICEMLWPSIRMQAHENDPRKSYATKMAEWWNKVILYAIPPTIGGLLGLLPVPFVFPPQDFATVADKAIFGVGVGWFSSFIYKVMRSLLKKTTGVDLPSDSLRPSEAPPATPG